MQLQKLLARLQKQRWISILLLVVTVAWMIAGGVADQLASRIITGMSVPVVPRAGNRKYEVQKTETRDQYQSVEDRNIFRLSTYEAPVAPPPKAITDNVDENNLVASKLPALLVGTLAGAEETSLCLIQDTRNRSVDVYAVGEDLFGMAKIFRIERQRVIVMRNGKQEVLIVPENVAKRGRRSVSKGKSAQPVVAQPKLSVRQEEDGRFVLDKEEFGNMLSDLGPLLSSARVVPNFEKGKINGYKIFAIKPGSIYEKIGMRNGDVIDSINGLRVQTPDKALMMFQQLRSEDHFELEIRRGGEPQLFTYDLE